MTQKLLTVDEAAERFALQPSTIRKLIYARRVPFVKLGRAVLRVSTHTLSNVSHTFSNVSHTLTSTSTSTGTSPSTCTTRLVCATAPLLSLISLAG